MFLLLSSTGIVSMVRSATKSAQAAGSSITLSATSGPPGTHVFITGSGYTPGEKVQPIWNYNGPGTVVRENSFYYFSPIGIADANGVVHQSIFIPTFALRDYTIASVGLTSGIVSTTIFHLTPEVETGTYIGSAGSVLRLIGWGFGYKESVSLYWNWNSTTSTGQYIGNAATDTTGAFTKRTFTVPANTPYGVYNVAAVGATTKVVTLTKFIVGAPMLTQQQGTHDWVNFGYDLQGTRANSTETVISTSNAATLAVKWKGAFPIPYRITGSPVVSNGIVYVGTVQGTLVAFNASTGSIVWTFNANGPIYGSPTIHNGIAYFGTVDSPGGGVIGNYAYALNATDGSLIWKNYLAYGAAWVTPLVYNGVVYFPSAAREAISGGFNAFNATNGAVVWQFSTPEGIWASPTIDPTGKNLYVNTGNPCLDSGGGNCGGIALDLNPTTGATIWQNHLSDLSGDDDIPTTSTYNNGNVYVGSKNGIFYCLNGTTGAILWQYDTGKRGDSGIFSSAAFYANRVYFGGGDGLTHALNAANGSVAWTFKMLSTRNFASPAEANGVLYTAGGDGTVYALNVATGVVHAHFR